MSFSEEDMCTQGGMEPGMCGSRSVSSSSTTAAAADEWRMLLLGSDSLRWAISGMARCEGASLSRLNYGERVREGGLGGCAVLQLSKALLLFPGTWALRSQALWGMTMWIPQSRID